VFQVDPRTLPNQIKRLKDVKASRDNHHVATSLKGLKQAAFEKKNLMPYLLDTVKSYATVGEIVAVLKEVYGEASNMSVI